jgi:hypothetical protein
VQVEAFAMGWSLVQKSPAKCLNKITKPPVWGGQGPYKDCRATDDNGDDDESNMQSLMALHSHTSIILVTRNRPSYVLLIMLFLLYLALN